MMDGLRARLAEVEVEHERMHEGLKRISGLDCTGAVGAVCSDNGDDIMKWCLSCYAKAVLHGVSDIPDRQKAGAAKMVTDLLARAKKAEKDADQLRRGERAADMEITRLRYKIECLEEENHDQANQAAIVEMKLGARVDELEGLLWGLLCHVPNPALSDAEDAADFLGAEWDKEKLEWVRS
jgi:hypothetical protein